MNKTDIVAGMVESELTKAGENSTMKPLRFIQFTDVHIRDQVDAHALEKFFEGLRQVCLDEKVDFVVNTGDLFDTRDYLIRAAATYRRLVEEFPVPVYTTIGNHDVWVLGETEAQHKS